MAPGSAAAQLTPQPLAPLAAAVAATGAGWGRVERVYIECTADKAIHIDLQRRMERASPCRRVFCLASSHSPFLSMPQELALILTEL